MDALEIPLHINSAQAMAELARLGAAGGTAGGHVEDGAKKATTAYERMAESVLAVGAAQVGIGTVTQTFAAISHGLQETSDYAAKVAKEFTDLRHSLMQVAALTGGKGDAAMTVAQAEQGAAAALTGPEWKDVQEKFQAQAGAYIGNAPGSKLSATQAIGVQQRVGEFAKARGIAPGEAMALMGTVVQEAAPGTTPEEMLSKFGSLFQVAEKAVGATAPQLAKIQELTGSGFESGEAARAANIFAVGAQGEEATYAMIARRALDDVRLKGQGAELGLERGQSPLQMMEAAAGKLSERVAGGEDEAELLKKYFADSREQRAMRILMNRGVGANEFENTRKLLGSTSADYVESTITDYEKTPEGRQQAAEAMAGLNRIRQGALAEELEVKKAEARAQLEGEGRFKQFAPSDLLRGASVLGLSLGQGSREEQLVRERTEQNVLAEAQGAGVDTTGQRTGTFLTKGTAPEDAMIALLAQIKAQGDHANEQRAKAAEKPLVAMPPNPTARP